MTPQTNAPTITDAAEVFNALRTFINQRPGLDFAGYGGGPDGRRAYFAEVRAIGKDRKRALEALRDAERLPTQHSDLLAEAFQRAFSGRLEWKVGKSDYSVSMDHTCPCGMYVHPTTRKSIQYHIPDCSYYDRGSLEYTTGQYRPTEYRKAAASVLETYVSLCNARRATEHPVQYAYRTMADVRAASKTTGHHFFDATTMRFFNSRVVTQLYAGRWFVTSEHMDADHVIGYTVREAKPDGDVDTVGDFQQYSTLADARDAVRALRAEAK